MTTVFAAAFGVVVLVALFDWRRGLPLGFAVGFAQDAARKLLPSSPVIAVVAVAVAFAAATAGVWLRGDRLGVRPFLRLFPRLRGPVVVFVAVVLLQSLATLVRTGSPVLAGLGLLAYLSPLATLGLGHLYCRDFSRMRLWMSVYLAGAGVVMVSVYLQLMGVSSPIFRSIGRDLVYSQSFPGAIRTLCGVMRSAEIAAWHLAAAACLGLAATAAARSALHRWAGGGAVALLLLAVTLTGRRKMLAEFAVFAVLFGLLILAHRRGGSRLLQLFAGGLLAGVLALQLFTRADSGQSRLAPYLSRSVTTLGDSADRLAHMTIGQFRWVLLTNGWMGSGAGTGAQGSQYFGGGAAIVGGAAEGGAGKVLAELGLPGLAAMVWLVLASASVFIALARWSRSLPLHRALPLLGLIAFLGANAAVFLTAHQVFGDPFVLLVLGFCGGTAMAHVRMVANEGRRAEPRPVAARVARPDIAAGRLAT